MSSRSRSRRRGRCLRPRPRSRGSTRSSSWRSTSTERCSRPSAPGTARARRRSHASTRGSRCSTSSSCSPASRLSSGSPARLCCGVPADEMGTLREQLGRPGAFVVAAELVTSRGLLSAESGRALQARARGLAANPRIDVLSITDNPGGHAMLAPDTLGHDLLSLGQDVVIHLSCKDWNRNALESRGWKLRSEGFRNVLCMSGDYPVTGHRGHAAPVFDIDSVGLIGMFAEMNAGLHDQRKPDGALGRTDFFLGCVVTNHKRHEREVMPQYLKLTKKVAAGARFVINQIGYDTRKDDELLRWIRRAALPVAALANVYLLSPAAARAFNRGAIPGVVVTDELLALV